MCATVQLFYTMEFGRNIKTSHFPHIDAVGTPILNAGSFGITPKQVLDAKIKFIQEFESYGDLFVRKKFLSLYMKSVESLADFLNICARNCVLVDNVTTGVACIFRSLLKEGDGVLLTSWTYGGVKMSTEYHADKLNNVSLYFVDFKLPILSEDDIVERFREKLMLHKDIRIVVVDHITSSTACLMPVKRLVQLCKEMDKIVILDGAHAIGQVPEIDIEHLDCDFYLSALHKWMFLPKAVALLWMKNEYKDVIKPLTISWLLNDPEVQYRFAFLGSREISSFFCCPQSVDFIKNDCGGLDRIYHYCSSLADKSCQYLTNLWNTSLMNFPRSMQAPYMRMILLPNQFQREAFLDKMIEDRFWSISWKLGIDMLNLNVILLKIENQAYIRVSVCIIVDFEDIKRLGDALLNVTEQQLDELQP